MRFQTAPDNIQYIKPIFFLFFLSFSLSLSLYLFLYPQTFFTRKKFCAEAFNEVTCNAKANARKEKRATKRIRELLCQFSDGSHCKTGTSADFFVFFVLVKEKKKRARSRRIFIFSLHCSVFFLFRCVFIFLVYFSMELLHTEYRNWITQNVFYNKLSLRKLYKANLNKMNKFVGINEIFVLLRLLSNSLVVFLGFLFYNQLFNISEIFVWSSFHIIIGFKFQSTRETQHQRYPFKDCFWPP